MSPASLETWGNMSENRGWDFKHVCSLGDVDPGLWELNIAEKFTIRQKRVRMSIHTHMYVHTYIYIYIYMCIYYMYVYYILMFGLLSLWKSVAEKCKLQWCPKREREGARETGVNIVNQTEDMKMVGNHFQ